MTLELCSVGHREPSKVFEQARDRVISLEAE